MGDEFRLEVPYREAYRLDRLTFGTGSPVVCVVAGVHGTELNGVHALNLVARSLSVARPAGTVHLFPVINRFGLDQATKRWPFDDRDINTVFPGDPAGAPIERLAHAVMEATRGDVCVDVHSGSPMVRELAQARVPLTGREVELARAMALPVVWRRTGDRLEPTGLVGAWRSGGAAALHVVAGRGGMLDLGPAREVAHGLLRLLTHLGLVPELAEAGRVLVDTTRAGVRYAYSQVGGFWVPEVQVGDRVSDGHLLGTVNEVVGGSVIEEVRATKPGVVVTLRTYPLVHARELLVRVAEPVG